MHGAPRRRPLARARLPLPPSHPPFPRPPQEKLVEEFNFLKAQASEPLATFLDYVTYGYMIDNMTLVLLGRGKDRELSDLLEKCHPLGVFTEMKAIVNIEDAKELFHTVLVDTPLGQYFGECIDMDDIENDTNIEIIRNTLYKVTAAAAAQLGRATRRAIRRNSLTRRPSTQAYLEDFYAFCQKLGGSTAEVMTDILSLEADRRAINITVNSIDTALDLKAREKLYPTVGLLYPEGTSRLAKATDVEAVRAAIDAYPVSARPPRRPPRERARVAPPLTHSSFPRRTTGACCRTWGLRTRRLWRTPFSSWRSTSTACRSSSSSTTGCTTPS